MRSPGRRIGFALLAVSVATIAAASAQDTVPVPGPPLRDACHRNDGEKLVRIVGTGESCAAHETAFQFGQGSPGEPGEPGVSNALLAETNRSVVLGGRADVALLRSIPAGSYALWAKITVGGSAASSSVTCELSTDPPSTVVDMASWSSTAGQASATLPLIATVTFTETGSARLSCRGTWVGAPTSAPRTGRASILAVRVGAQNRSDGAP